MGPRTRGWCRLPKPLGHHCRAGSMVPARVPLKSRRCSLLSVCCPSLKSVPARSRKLGSYRPCREKEVRAREQRSRPYQKDVREENTADAFSANNPDGQIQRNRLLRSLRLSHIRTIKRSAAVSAPEISRVGPNPIQGKIILAFPIFGCRGCQAINR